MTYEWNFLKVCSSSKILSIQNLIPLMFMLLTQLLLRIGVANFKTIFKKINKFKVICLSCFSTSSLITDHANSYGVIIVGKLVLQFFRLQIRQIHRQCFIRLCCIYVQHEWNELHNIINSFHGSVGREIAYDTRGLRL